MKVISQEESQAHYHEVIKGGLIGGSVTGLLGATGVILASRRWAGFRSLTIPFRTFLITSSATAGAVITAERHSINFSRAKDPRNFYKDAAELARETAREQETSWKRFVDYCRENRYTIVGLGWVASMAVAFTLVSRNRYLTTSQKLVQARVYAQGLTLALILAAGAFETADAKSGKGRWESVMVLDPNDPEHKKMIEKRVHKEEYEGQDLWKGEFNPPDHMSGSKRLLTHVQTWLLPRSGGWSTRGSPCPRARLRTRRTLFRLLPPTELIWLSTTGRSPDPRGDSRRVCHEHTSLAVYHTKAPLELPGHFSTIRQA